MSGRSCDHVSMRFGVIFSQIKCSNCGCSAHNNVFPSCLVSCCIFRKSVCHRCVPLPGLTREVISINSSRQRRRKFRCSLLHLSPAEHVLLSYWETQLNYTSWGLSRFSLCQTGKNIFPHTSSENVTRWQHISVTVVHKKPEVTVFSVYCISIPDVSACLEFGLRLGNFSVRDVREDFVHDVK